MPDWTRNPHVLGAIQDYEFARFSWLEIADVGGRPDAEKSAEKAEAFERMQAADRAYVQARNDALDRPGLDFLRVVARAPTRP